MWITSLLWLCENQVKCEHETLQRFFSHFRSEGLHICTKDVLKISFVYRPRQMFL